MDNVMDKDFIYLDTEFQTQNELFYFIANKMVESNRGNDADKIVEGFFQREKEFSTAMMDGIAIPHCRNDEIKKSTVIVVRNKNDIVWTDDSNVNLFFALLIPKVASEYHIRILAQVAQLLIEEDFISSVKKAEEVEIVYTAMQAINTLK